jgi:hypothetical protein
MSDTATRKHHIDWRVKLRYRTDEVLSRGTLGILLWLGAIFLAVVVAAALVITILGKAFADDQKGFIEAAWGSLMRTLDAGTMSGDSGWGLRGAALFVTVAGIFLASALIGIIATGLDQKIGELQKGRSFVVERGHTAILGWSPRLHTIISELTIANENHPGLAIVVLADRDKMEMEDEIRDRVRDLRGSKLVCRTGDPASLGDLGLVNAMGARSIIVLGDADDESGEPMEEFDIDFTPVMVKIGGDADEPEAPAERNRNDR